MLPFGRRSPLPCRSDRFHSESRWICTKKHGNLRSRHIDDAKACERLVIHCQTLGVSAAHATHCATYCTPCRPLIRAFSGWIRTAPPAKGCETEAGGGAARPGRVRSECQCRAAASVMKNHNSTGRRSPAAPVDTEQWLKRHPEAGSSWSSWPKASHAWAFSYERGVSVAPVIITIRQEDAPMHHLPQRRLPPQCGPLRSPPKCHAGHCGDGMTFR